MEELLVEFMEELQVEFMEELLVEFMEELLGLVVVKVIYMLTEANQLCYFILPNAR